jgi:hypothetical protein
MKRFLRLYIPKGKGRIFVWSQDNIVYVRVPKSGNTSFCNVLEDGRKKIVDLSRLRVLYPGCKVFSFVRNPWARLVSGYNEKMSQPEFSNDRPARRLREIDKRFRPGMPFEEFAKLICMLPDNRTEKHFRSQSYFLKHEGQLIPDFVGRLEQIEQDWPALQEAMGIQLQLQHINKTDNLDYRSYYPDTDIRDCVGNRYVDDINIFGYEFDNE